MIEKLVDQIEARFKELSDQMSDPDVINDRERYAQVGRDYSALEPAHQLAVEYRRTADDAEGARELLADGEDPEMREMLQTSEQRLAELEEAGLFAGDVYRMLLRYAERRGFKTETLNEADGDYTFEVRGDGAYSVFKYEGGTHRVQRVPKTESQGRIHTSTATVAVLPEA